MSERELPKSLGMGHGPSDLSTRRGFTNPAETTVVELRYFHPDSDNSNGMVEYRQTVPVNRVHLIIEKMDEVAE